MLEETGTPAEGEETVRGLPPARLGEGEGANSDKRNRGEVKGARKAEPARGEKLHKATPANKAMREQKERDIGKKEKDGERTWTSRPNSRTEQVVCLSIYLSVSQSVSSPVCLSRRKKLLHVTNLCFDLRFGVETQEVERSSHCSLSHSC